MRGAGDEHRAPPGGAVQALRDASAGQRVGHHEHGVRSLLGQAVEDAHGVVAVLAGVQHGVGARRILDQPRARLSQRADQRVGRRAGLLLDEDARRAAARGLARRGQQRRRLCQVVAGQPGERAAGPPAASARGSPGPVASVKPGSSCSTRTPPKPEPRASRCSIRRACW